MMAEDGERPAMSRPVTRRAVLAGGLAAVAGAAAAATFAGRGPDSPRASTASGGTQPAALVWGAPRGTELGAYARPGGLVSVGRDNFADPFALGLAAAGATVIAYLDPIIDNAYGPHHEMLIGRSALGPQVDRWPGAPRANAYGYLVDFRVGSVLQNKFGPLLEQIVAQNPHIAGFLLDDVGTRSWYPGFDFDAWPAAARQEYRRGAIELVRTARAVADRHDLLILVNGTWSADDGGGYPRADRHGCALVDGGVIENHSVAEIPFFSRYAASDQWASMTMRRRRRMWVINDADPHTRAAYAAAGVADFATSQVDRDTPDRPWAPITDVGLPRRAR